MAITTTAAELRDPAVADHIRQAEALVGHTFGDKTLLLSALTHPSYVSTTWRHLCVSTLNREALPIAPPAASSSQGTGPLLPQPSTPGASERAEEGPISLAAGGEAGEQGVGGEGGRALGEGEVREVDRLTAELQLEEEVVVGMDKSKVGKAPAATATVAASTGSGTAAAAAGAGGSDNNGSADRAAEVSAVTSPTTTPPAPAAATTSCASSPPVIPVFPFSSGPPSASPSTSNTSTNTSASTLGPSTPGPSTPGPNTPGPNTSTDDFAPSSDDAQNAAGVELAEDLEEQEVPLASLAAHTLGPAASASINGVPAPLDEQAKTPEPSSSNSSTTPSQGLDAPASVGQQDTAYEALMTTLTAAVAQVGDSFFAEVLASAGSPAPKKRAKKAAPSTGPSWDDVVQKLDFAPLLAASEEELGSLASKIASDMASEEMGGWNPEEEAKKTKKKAPSILKAGRGGGLPECHVAERRPMLPRKKCRILTRFLPLAAFGQHKTNYF